MSQLVGWSVTLSDIHAASFPIFNRRCFKGCKLLCWYFNWFWMIFVFRCLPYLYWSSIVLMLFQSQWVPSQRVAMHIVSLLLVPPLPPPFSSAFRPGLVFCCCASCKYEFHLIAPYEKMTGGTPEVRSNKSLTLGKGAKKRRKKLTSVSFMYMYV